MQVHSRHTVRPTMSGPQQQQQAAAHNQGGRVVRPPQENPNHPPPPPQKCPRCDSANTKFCYYNNYSLSQPRYFCKACRRYWTQGGTLRNIPVGGGCRKGKRPKLSPSTSHHEISSGTQIQSLANPSSSSATPAYSSQSLAGFHHQQALRAANPLMMSGGNYYYNSSGGGGGFYSSLPTHQGGVAGGGGQFGGNVALLQGMNFQSSRPQPQPQVSTQQQQMIPHQQAPPQWTQGFINSTAAANSSSMMAPNTTSTFWSGANVGDQSNSNMSQQQAGTSSFSYDQWKWNNYNNNQGFDHSR